MPSATNKLESMVGDALFMGQPFITVTQWTLHLFTTQPNEDGQGGTEVTAGDYQPVRYDPGAERWEKAANPDVYGNTVYQNIQPINFIAASSWGWVNAFGLKNQAGDFLYLAPITGSKQVNAGEAMVFLPGQLQFPIG